MFAANKCPRIAIIDYGMGNLFSIQQACEFVGLNHFITMDKKELLTADAAILPGVGAFGDAMNNLLRLDLIDPIKDFIDSGKPFMGICLGMQLLMTESEEFGKHRGLDIFKGFVTKFPENTKDGRKRKVPQVGWNKIFMPKAKGQNCWDATALEGVPQGNYMYFVHSYFVKPESEDIVLSITSYEEIEYCSSISWKNVFACQFHPEKSGDAGLKIYNKFGEILLKGGENG